MCEDADVNYEWLMRGVGLSVSEKAKDVVIVTDPDLIKMVRIGEALPDHARKLAVKEVDNVRQLVEQTIAAYKNNGTEK